MVRPRGGWEEGPHAAVPTVGRWADRAPGAHGEAALGPLKVSGCCGESRLSLEGQRVPSKGAAWRGASQGGCQWPEVARGQEQGAGPWLLDDLSCLGGSPSSSSTFKLEVTSL